MGDEPDAVVGVVVDGVIVLIGWKTHDEEWLFALPE